MKEYSGKVFKGELTDKLLQLCPPPMGLATKNGVYAAEYVRPDDGVRILYLANATKSAKSVNVEQEGKYLIYDPYDCTVTEASGKTSVKVPGYRAVLIVRDAG